MKINLIFEHHRCHEKYVISYSLHSDIHYLDNNLTRTYFYILEHFYLLDRLQIPRFLHNMDIHRTLAQGLSSYVFEKIYLCHMSGYTPSNSTMQTILRQLQYFEYCLVVLIGSKYVFHGIGNIA